MPQSPFCRLPTDQMSSNSMLVLAASMSRATAALLSVFHQDDPDHYRKLEDFRVQHAVHSLAVDPKTHRVYTPEQEEDGKPVARMVVYEAVTWPLAAPRTQSRRRREIREQS